MPITPGGENTGGVIRSSVLGGDSTGGINRGDVVGREATLVVVG